MRPYFEKMKEFGSALKPGMIKSRENNVKLIKDVEAEISKAVDKVRNVGLPAAEINKRKQLTIWQRLEYLLARHMDPIEHALQPQRQQDWGSGNRNLPSLRVDSFRPVIM